MPVRLELHMAHAGWNHLEKLQKGEGCYNPSIANPSIAILPLTLNVTEMQLAPPPPTPLPKKLINNNK